MAIVKISLPDKLKDYIEERVNEGGYRTTSGYFRDLVREDQKREAKERLEMLLLAGLDSPATEWTKADEDHVQDAVRAKLAEKRSYP